MKEAAPSALRELARIGAGAALVTLPFALGTALGDVPHDERAEGRYAWVIGSACLAVLVLLVQDALGSWRSGGSRPSPRTPSPHPSPAVAGEGAAPGGSTESAAPRTGRRRHLLALPFLAPLAHVLAPRSVALTALDALVLVVAATALAARATRRIYRAPISRGARWGALGLVFALVPGPLFTLAWGLLSMFVAPAATRLFHSDPYVGPSETAVEIPSRDGTILRGTFAEGRDGAPAVLLVHGLADSRRRLVPWAEELEGRGAHVLRIDLRGHGTSEGVAVTLADREPDDVAAALAWLAGRPHVGALHVLAVSMGGGAALEAISRGGARVESTVALAPASDFHAIVDRRLPPFEPLHFLASSVVRGVTHGVGHRAPLELVPADAVVAAGPARILVVHSRTDRTIPAEVTEALVARAPWVEVAWIDGVSHVDTPEHALEDEPLRDRIERFLGVRDP
ncbi:MAG: alpha/beta fold hydrolase [Sandaracinus sp.]